MALLTITVRARAASMWAYTHHHTAASTVTIGSTRALCPRFIGGTLPFFRFVTNQSDTIRFSLPEWHAKLLLSPPISGRG